MSSQVSNLVTPAFPVNSEEEEALNRLRELVRDNHNTCRRGLLLAFLRFARNNDVQKAAEMLIKSRQHRSCKITSLTLPSEYSGILSTRFFHPLNFPTNEGHPIILWKVGGLDLGTKYNFQDMLAALSFAFGAIVIRQCPQTNGVVFILDFDGFGKSHFVAVAGGLVKALLSTQGTLPLRIKGIHVFNSGYTYQILDKMIKPLLKKKMQQRVIIHKKDSEILREYVNPEFLPTRYGGDCEKDPYEVGFLQRVYDTADLYKDVIE